MNRTATALLEFDPALNRLGKDKEIRHGLSAVVQLGDALWLANDESVALERLTWQGVGAGGEHRYGGHKRFPLGEQINLPVPPPADGGKFEEADLEGLCHADGYLWLVGSHSFKRSKPEEGDSVEKNFKRLAKVTSDGNRFLLARLPLTEDGRGLSRKVERAGRTLTAAQLSGDDKGDDLTGALGGDEHLGPFLPIPGKDNGFDIEGLTVAGERLFIGLRGPVLRGWAVILELEPEAADAHTLRLKKIGPGSRPYRKHFLRLGGLGIRSLSVQGDDLLILAGPTMDLDGPVTFFRWPGGARRDGESVVFPSGLKPVLDVPFGQGADAGKDHAEGSALFSLDGSAARSLIVVYDSVAEGRLRGESAVEADIFALPA